MDKWLVVWLHSLWWSQILSNVAKYCQILPNIYQYYWMLYDIGANRWIFLDSVRCRLIGINWLLISDISICCQKLRFMKTWLISLDAIALDNITQSCQILSSNVQYCSAHSCLCCDSVWNIQILFAIVKYCLTWSVFD